MEHMKVRERRDKGDPEVEQEVQRYIDARLYNIPHPFSAKDVVVELIGKPEHALRSESKSTAVHQKETKLIEKRQISSVIMSRRRWIDHPQKWKILYLSIDWSPTVASHVREMLVDSSIEGAGVVDGVVETLAAIWRWKKGMRD